MGKSIRSKRKKRLRTIKREIVVPHYDAKELAKMAVQEAALSAPKIELPKRREDVEENSLSLRGRAGPAPVVPMSVDGNDSNSIMDAKLKPTRVIGKRGKSRKRDLSSKRKKNVPF